MFIKYRKEIPKLSPAAFWPGAMTDPQLLELPMSRTNFHGPKDVRAIEVRLYIGDSSETMFHFTSNLKFEKVVNWNMLQLPCSNIHIYTRNYKMYAFDPFMLQLRSIFDNSTKCIYP